MKTYQPVTTGIGRRKTNGNRMTHEEAVQSGLRPVYEQRVGRLRIVSDLETGEVLARYGADTPRKWPDDWIDGRDINWHVGEEDNAEDRAEDRTPATD